MGYYLMKIDEKKEKSLSHNVKESEKEFLDPPLYS